MACLPIQIAGRNRVWRKMVLDAIRNDPDWKDGEYKEEPKQALRAAQELLVIAGSAPVLMQQKLPTQAAADKYVADAVEPRVATLDANDLLYQVNASRNYDPSSRLETISAPVLWINSADDFINPPELGIAERESKRLKNGTFVLLPISDKTHGHGTHTWAVAWREYMEQFLKKTAH
jgi:homoserine O-acetyltransferase